MLFPQDRLQVVPLYRDEVALRDTQANSTAAAALTKVQAVYHDLFFPAPPPDRPYTFASIVLSLDGKLAYPDDPQGPVVASANFLDQAGGRIDFWVLNVLRAHADASIIGARTLAAEPEAEFGCLDHDLDQERIRVLGKPNALLPVVVSLDGTDIPLEHRVFSRSEKLPLIATGRAGGAHLMRQGLSNVLWLGPFETAAAVDGADVVSSIQAARRAGQQIVLMTGGDHPDAPLLLRALRRIGVEHLLIESPTYWWMLMGERVLDELFVNYSSVYIGGALTPGVAMAHSSHDHPHAKFLYVGLHPDGFLYTRQQLIYGLSRPA